MTGKPLEAASHLSLTSGLSTTEKEEPETLEFIKSQILSTTGVSVFISDSDTLNLTHTHMHTYTHSLRSLRLWVMFCMCLSPHRLLCRRSLSMGTITSHSGPSDQGYAFLMDKELPLVTLKTLSPNSWNKAHLGAPRGRWFPE